MPRTTPTMIEHREIQRDWLRRNRVKLMAAEAALEQWKTEVARIWKERFDYIMSGTEK
jgi:hypothetical protein